MGNLDLDSLVKLSVGSYKGQIFILTVDHRRRCRFGTFNTATITFEELLNTTEMEEVDHKFHAAQLYFVPKADLFGSK